MSPASAAGKGHDPRAMSTEGRKQFDRTLRNIYGTRVKIPPPGPEREELKREIFIRVQEQAAGADVLESIEVGLLVVEELAGRGGA